MSTPTLRTTVAPANRVTGRLRITLVVLLVAQFMLAVDFSILNVALPAIGAGLRFRLADLQWIATTFALSAAGFTLLLGRVGDLIGRRRIFLAGLAVLTAASLLGGFATTPAILLVARVAQGLATAAVTPAGLALLTTSFPDGPMRQKALGLNGALMSAGFTTGAILGGVLTDLLSWRWSFLLNVPVAVAVLLVAPAVITESRPSVRPRLDLPGALSVTVGLLGIVYGLTQAGEHGFTRPTALVPLLAGAALLVVFYRVERRTAEPLVPVRILTRRTVAWGNVAGLIAFVTETSLVYLLTLYLQKTLGFSALGAGLSFGVLGIGTVLGGVAAPRLIARTSPTVALVLGGLVQAAGTGALLAIGAHPGWLALVLPATFVGGIGNMAVIVGFMITATSGLPATEQGLASGLATMAQQVGITMGTPVLSAVATAAMAGAAGGSAVLHGVRVAIGVNVAIVLLGVALAAGFLARRRPPVRP